MRTVTVTVCWLLILIGAPPVLAGPSDYKTYQELEEYFSINTLHRLPSSISYFNFR